MILVKKNKKYKIKKKKLKFFFKKYKKIIMSLSLIIISLLFLLITLKTIFLSEKYKIKKIEIGKETIETLNNPLLYKSIENYLSGKNVLLLKLGKLKNIEKKLKEEYPIINKIKIDWQNNILTVHIVFNLPSLIFYNQKEYIGFLNGKRFIVNKNSPRLKKNIIINLPSYTYKYGTKLTGFFFLLSPYKLKKDIKEIYSFLHPQKIIYYPGGLISKVELTSGMYLYFNHRKEISNQIKKFLLIKKYFSGYNKLEYLDVGSQDNISFGKLNK